MSFLESKSTLIDKPAVKSLIVTATGISVGILGIATRLGVHYANSTNVPSEILHSPIYHFAKTYPLVAETISNVGPDIGFLLALTGVALLATQGIKKLAKSPTVQRLFSADMVTAAAAMAMVTEEATRFMTNRPENFNIDDIFSYLAIGVGLMGTRRMARRIRQNRKT